MNHSVLPVDACGGECGCACLSHFLCVCVCGWGGGGGGDECVCFLFLFDVYACGACIPNSLICVSLSHFLKHSHTLIGQSVLSHVVAT